MEHRVILILLKKRWGKHDIFSLNDCILKKIKMIFQLKKGLFKTFLLNISQYCLHHQTLG